MMNYARPVQGPLRVRPGVQLGHALQERVPGASSNGSSGQATGLYRRVSAATDTQQEPLSKGMCAQRFSPRRAAAALSHDWVDRAST